MVYVDELTPCIPNRNWRWRESCHLIADTLEELHIFAAAIGMRRSWFQVDSRLPHYDLNASRRRIAVSRGAVELTRREFVLKMRELSPSIAKIVSAS